MTEDSSTPTTTTNYNRWITILIGVIAIAAIVFGVLAWIQTTRDKTHLENMQQKLLTARVSASTQVQDLNSRIAEISQQLMATQANVVHIIKMVGNSERQRTLSQISYLINLANLHLLIGRDVGATINLLKLAHQRTLSLSDPELLVLEKALNNDIHALQQMPKINVADIIIQIDDLNKQIKNLPIIPKFKDKQLNANKKPSLDQHEAWYKRFWHSLESLKEVVIIRHHNTETAPLLTPIQAAFLQDNISSKLIQAEWALLHHEPTLYKANLNLVAEWLTQYFHDSKLTSPIVKQLQTLAVMNVDPKVPSISGSLDAIGAILNKINQWDIQSPKPTNNPNKNSKPTNKNNTNKPLSPPTDNNPGVAT